MKLLTAGSEPTRIDYPKLNGERYVGSTATISFNGVEFPVKSINYTTEPYVVGADVGRGRDKTVFSVHGYKSGVVFVADEAVGLGTSDGPWCDLLARLEGLDRWALRDALRGVRGVCQLPARRRWLAAKVMIHLRAGAAQEFAVEFARLDLERAGRRRARNERKRRDGMATGRRQTTRVRNRVGGGAS